MISKPEYYYRQVAAIAWRGAGEAREVLLITTRKRNRWIIPKGIVEPEMTEMEAALAEAHEEGGLRGTIDPEPLGSFEYAKWGGVCRATVYALEVTEELDDYPEAGLRKRQWLPLTEAAARVELPGVGPLILALTDRLAGTSESR